MTRIDHTRLARLAQLAAMIRDRDLARLARLQQEDRQISDQIAALSTRVELGDDPGLNAARLAHAHWAQTQRVRLNMTLARQKAHTLDARHKAARSVGRALALDRVQDR